ncbi:enoyl-CoA hydratase/isomerase family protein, partial [Burkholderia oklahomensis]
VTPAPNASALAAARASIDKHFARADVAAIAASLDAERDDAVRAAWVDKARDAMRGGSLSPLSMAVSVEVVERARGATMADCLRRDLDLTRSTFARGDVIEGVRAVIVDKDHAPKWHYPTIPDVTAEAVAEMFESPWRADEHPLMGLRD